MEISRKIIDYAIWYYLKYYPSPKKLRYKLFEKFWPDSEKWQKYWWISYEDIDFIINEKMSSIIQEEDVINSKIRLFIQKWKSKKYIKQKLFERQEDIDLSTSILESYFENGEFESISKEIEKIIKKLSLDKDNLDFSQRNKIIQKLLLKWFDYSQIKELI